MFAHKQDEHVPIAQIVSCEDKLRAWLTGDARMTQRPLKHKGPTILRGAAVDLSTTDQRLLDSRGPSDWVHTDPWRVLRIQAEFVEGFGALAELGPAIGVFGSARTSADDPFYAKGEAARPRAGRGRLRGDHRRRSGCDGGRQQGRLRRPAASRSGSASSCPSSPGSTSGSTSA